jgi:hypothetical protein
VIGLMEAAQPQQREVFATGRLQFAGRTNPPLR